MPAHHMLSWLRGIIMIWILSQWKPFFSLTIPIHVSVNWFLQVHALPCTKHLKIVLDKFSNDTGPRQVGESFTMQN